MSIITTMEKSNEIIHCGAGETAGPPVLQVTALSVSCRQEQSRYTVVDEVSFSIDSGRSLGLVGESGCGKSMTALALSRILPRACRITGGQIRFGGLDLAAAPEAKLQQIRGRDITVVFQDPSGSLNPVMTIAEQIREVLTLHRRDLAVSETESFLQGLLESVGLTSPETKLRSYPHQLSGGEKQRVMIAMAISCRPQLVIADEPTTALDVTVQARILALLRRQQQQQRFGLLFISHDLNVISEIADQVAVMYAGRIVELTDVATVMRQPRHPYTQGLLACLPSRHPRGTRRLQAIDGDVPQPGAVPSGCRFHPRCPRAFDRCRQEEPPSIQITTGHEVRCWLYCA